MFTATLCLLQDQIESADDAVTALECDFGDLDHAHPAKAAIRNVQSQYRELIRAQRLAIDELRKLTPDEDDPTHLIQRQPREDPAG